MNSGQKLSVIDTGDSILLRPSRSFKNTELEQVAGILKYSIESPRIIKLQIEY